MTGNLYWGNPNSLRILAHQRTLRRSGIDLLPGLVGVERGHALGDPCRAIPEVLLEYSTGVTDHEGHHTGIAILRWMGDQREAADHLALDHIVERAAGRVRSLRLQDSIVAPPYSDWPLS